MIKIILKDGTQIEMDTYSQEVFDSIKAIARGQQTAIVSNGRFCVFCKLPLMGNSKKKLCGSVLCSKKQHRIYSRKYYIKKMARLSQAVTVANATPAAPENIAVNLIG